MEGQVPSDKKVKFDGDKEEIDSLDGEEEVEKEDEDSGNRSSNEDDDDDVDKEEEGVKSKPKPQVEDDVNAEEASGKGEGGIIKKLAETIVLHSGLKDETSVDREEHEHHGHHHHHDHDAHHHHDQVLVEDGVELEIPHERSHHRHSIQENEERVKFIKKKIRKSLKVPRKLSPLKRFDISKNAFRQQRIPIIWQPIWNCNSVGKLLLVLAIVTLPFALYLFFVQTFAQEYRFTFGEECKNSRNYLRLVRSMCVFCGGALNPHCSKVIQIPEDMKTPVYLYYELTGFHQNHRMICKSVDYDQLLGNIFTSDGKAIDPSENCGKYSKDEYGRIYFPCGQLANLMYSDDFSLATPSGEVVPLRTHGIALNALKYFRFKNPPSITPKDYNLNLSFKNLFVKPKGWTIDMWHNWWKGGGLENERFINWMNPSTFAHFRKLYAVIDHVPSCNPGLFCKGNYTMNIEYRFDTDGYGGNKAFILAKTTHLGGQNYNLPLLVGTIGCVELILGLLLLQIDQMVKSMEHRRHHHHRRSTLRKHTAQDERLNMDVAYEPPPTPKSGPIKKLIPGAAAITITHNEEDVVTVKGPRRLPATPPQPSEGLKEKPISFLFRNAVISKESHEVLPDDDGVDFKTDEEGESGDESFTSATSELVSAAEAETSGEEVDNDNSDIF